MPKATNTNTGGERRRDREEERDRPAVKTLDKPKGENTNNKNNKIDDPLQECPVTKGFVVKQETREIQEGGIIREVKKDIKLFFSMKGEHTHPDTPVLLFVCGLGTTTKNWSSVQDIFCRGYPCLCLDLRGFGRSDKPEDSPYSYDMFADDIKLVLEYLHIKYVYYIGTDIAASIGIHFATKYPQLILQLIVLGPNPKWTSNSREEWEHAQWTNVELASLWAEMKQDYDNAIDYLVNTWVLPDSCSNISKSHDEAARTIKLTPPNTLITILGGNDNKHSFVYEDLFDQVSIVDIMKIPLLVISGTKAEVQSRGATAFIYSKWIKGEAFFFQFIKRGNNAHMTDTHMFCQVLNNFLQYEDTKDRCDIGKF